MCVHERETILEPRLRGEREHVREASTSPLGTDRVSVAAHRSDNKTHRRQELTTCCCGWWKTGTTVASVGWFFFILKAVGMFVELKPFLLLKKKNFNGRMQE